MASFFIYGRFLQFLLNNQLLHEIIVDMISLRNQVFGAMRFDYSIDFTIFSN